MKKVNQMIQCIADPNSPAACTYMGLVFFLFFFGFLEFFFWLLTKRSKNLENTKKQKKNKIADPNSPAACTYMGLAVFFFFLVFWFSRFFLGFDQK